MDEHLYALAKKLDPDRLKIGMDTQFARFNPKGTSDYEGGPVTEWPRGSINPDRPFLCHEYLNRTVKLDARLEERFSGAWAPPVTRAQRQKFLAEAGLDDGWGALLQLAQHALQRHWHKSGVESARSDPYCDGYCLWTIVDVVVRQKETFTAQGVFNPFWGTKECGATPDSLARFNSPSVVLFDVPKNERVFRSGERVEVDFLFAHYGERLLGPETRLEWTLAADGKVLLSGRAHVGRQELGPARKVAHVKIAFPNVSKAVKATLTAHVGGTGTNDREFWIFPRRETPDGSFLAVSDALRPSFEKLFRNVRGVSDAERAEIVVAEADSPLLAAATGRGQRTIAIGDVNRSPTSGCKFWSLGREISSERQNAYRQPSPDISLGWWSMGAQVGTALKKHPALALLPHEGFLSPLLFGTIGKGRKLPFAGADAKTLIIVGEGGDSCYAYMAELENGRQIATWGLDLTSGRAEATAILDGIISYLRGMRGPVLLATGCHLPSHAQLSTESFVKASAFGWNATNATKCLQAAIDSGAAKVLIDRQAGDWIVEPVFLRQSNQEIVVADGVTVRAKKGAYKHPGDCLFKANCVSNVILRGEGSATLAMNKKDYQNPAEYQFSEWRHAVSIVGGHDITVRDLTILSSGGDGIYVRNAARNVRLDRLVCRDHHRQGISVISAVDLLVSNCRFEATSGTAPQCGLDIEPNVSKDRLENVVFEDCAFDGNASSGILLHLAPLDDTTRPISVTFRRCKSRGNGFGGVRINCVGPARRSVRGRIVFEDCVASGNKLHPLTINSKRSDALDIAFSNCTFDAHGNTMDAIRFDNGTFLADFGGVAFDNVRIMPGQGKAIAFEGIGIAADTMKGLAKVVRDDGKERALSLLDFSRDYPPNPEALRTLLEFKTETPNFRLLGAVPGEKPLAKPVSTGWLRKRFTFVQHIPSAGDYPIAFRVRPLGKRRGSARVQVLDAAGTDLGSFALSDGVTTNVIHATGAGVRRFVVTVASGLASVESVWPGHGLQADGYVHLFGGRNRRYWFAVPVGAEKTCVQIRPEEPCSARLIRPDGRVAAEMPLGGGIMVLEAKGGNTTAPEIWCLEFPQVDEDMEFRIGSPALPFASPSAQTALR